jgi:trehalose/maltose hydrolase-like predicted phosphorylase
MARPDIAAVRMRLVAEDGATVRAVAAVDGNVRNEDSNWEDAFGRMDGEEFPAAGRGLVANTTYKTEFGTATAMSAHLTRGVEACTAQGATAPGRVEATWECSLEAGEEATVTKYIAIATTLHAPAEAVREAAWTALDVAEAIGFEGL